MVNPFAPSDGEAPEPQQSIKDTEEIPDEIMNGEVDVDDADI